MAGQRAETKSLLSCGPGPICSLQGATSKTLPPHFVFSAGKGNKEGIGACRPIDPRPLIWIVRTAGKSSHEKSWRKGPHACYFTIGPSMSARRQPCGRIDGFPLE